MTDLERVYRRLLRAYPKAYRARCGDEIVTVLLDSAANGQRRVRPADAVDLVVSGLLARARLYARNPYAAAGLVAGVVLLFAAGGLVAQVMSLRGQFAAAAVSPSPVLPRELPGWGPIPTRAVGHPGGPAIASYVTGDEDGTIFTQLVGGVRATARRSGPGLLSQDGRFVAGVEGLDELGSALGRPGRLTVLDLSSGERKTVPAARVSDVDDIAGWSRDSRRLAWVAGGHVLVLDRSTGNAADLGPGTDLAFGPADDSFVVRVRGAVALHRADGATVRTLPVPTWARLGRAGVSPDGSCMVLSEFDDAPGWGQQGQSVVMDLTTGRLTALSRGDGALAWRDAHTLLVRVEGDARPRLEGDPAGADDRRLETVDLTSGRRSLVSRFPEGSDVNNLQVATALVPYAQLGGSVSYVDRGAVSSRSYGLLILAALLAAVFAWSLPMAAAPARPWWLRRWRLRTVALTLVSGVVLLLMAGYTYLLTTYTYARDVHLLILAGGCLVGGGHLLVRAWMRAHQEPGQTSS